MQDMQDKTREKAGAVRSLHCLASGTALDFQPGISEIDQKSDLDAAGLQIVDQLGLMLWSKSFYRFQFDDYFLFN